jgi:peptidoglycan-associated lipoprotein
MKVKVTVFVGMAAMIVAAACGGGQPEVVTPAIDSTAIRDSIAREEARRRAYEDSVRRAREEEDRLRREREEAARREAAMTAEVRNMLARSAIRDGRDTDVMQSKLAILQANGGLSIEIVGHCDERGSDEYNMALGMRRANAAKQWLVDRGIAEGRIVVKSMGEEQPTAMGSSEDAWAQNRRDEFTITAGGDQLVKPAGM